MLTRIFIASLLLLVPFAAGCGPAGAETANTATVRAAAKVGVAGNCPDGAGPMRPSPGTAADLNADGYVCTPIVRSASGDSLRLAVDNDAATPDSARREPDTYSGM